MADRVQNIILEVLNPADEGNAPDKNSPLVQWLTSHDFELCTVAGEKWDGNLPVLEANLWARRSEGNKSGASAALDEVR